MSELLRLEEVSIALGAQVLIPPLSLTVAPGQAVTLMGPSGAGKSALLAFICGTIDPAFQTRGRVFLGDREVSGLAPERRHIGILFQDDVLFPHLSVGQNLAFGLSPRVSGRAERAARIDAALADAGLAGFARRDPATLSGGQRARVALMRLLLAAPQALLLDEPFGRLDAALRADFRRFVLEHAIAAALPILMVTHDRADAQAAKGPILEISRASDGRPVIGARDTLKSRAGTEGGPSAAAASPLAG